MLSMNNSKRHTTITLILTVMFLATTFLNLGAVNSTWVPKNIDATAFASEIAQTSNGSPLFTRALQVPVLKSHIDQIYMVARDGAVLHGPSGLNEYVEPNTFVGGMGNYSPDKRASLPENRNNLVEVPSDMKNDFFISIKPKLSKSVKLYERPDKESTMERLYIVPDNLVTRDFTIYNTEFLQTMYNGKTCYVSTDDVDFSIHSNRALKVVSRGGNTLDNNKLVLVARRANISTDIDKPSHLSVTELKFITEGTGLEGIEEAVKEVEDTYGINSLFTLSVAAHESGWGESNLARTRNNLFGICAYDNNVGAASSFASKSDCVRYWGKLIKTEYFGEGRRTTQSVNSIYASDQSWSSKVDNTMYMCRSKILNE